MNSIYFHILFLIGFIALNIILFRIEWKMFKETKHYPKLKKIWLEFRQNGQR